MRMHTTVCKWRFSGCGAGDPIRYADRVRQAEPTARGNLDDHSAHVPERANLGKIDRAERRR